MRGLATTHTLNAAHKTREKGMRARGKGRGRPGLTKEGQLVETRSPKSPLS